jgi:lactoylglutathione lyase
VPEATLEILDREMAAGVDDFEVGRWVSGGVRLALGVADARETAAEAEAAGARTLGAPQVAPWGDTVARVESPEGMQLTLFSTP